MDDVHDYEYYEARAEDVKLEVITSDKHNADILARLRENDPEFKHIVFTLSGYYGKINFVVRERDDLGWLGYFVGKSEQLKELYIESFPVNNFNLNAFSEGLGHNRSIQCLHIRRDLGKSVQSFVPFLRNNDNLRILNFKYFDVNLQCARNIGLLLSQKSSLKRLNFDDISLDDEGLVQIAAALKSQPQIEELLLRSNNIVRDGYVALGRALERCLGLRELQLWTDFEREHDDNSENWLDTLAEGLKHCHNLTSLDLEGNQMKDGSRSLSTLFQSDNCRLERLGLGQMDIGDDGMTILATGLASLPSLRRLILRDNSIGDQGLQALVGALAGSGCNIEVLDLSVNDLMESVSGMRMLTGNELTESVSGMRALGTLVRRSTSMQSLSLSDNFLTDEGLQSFVESMANCCNLVNLYLSRNNSITGNGLASLSSLFQAERCSLCTLVVGGINIGDDGAAALANGLIWNKSLNTLRFNVSSITARGWAAFARLLCDTSSVNDTYLSNHTLEEIWDYARGIPCTPQDEDILQYLKWNKSLKQAAAICKILHSHPDIDIKPLFEFNLKCLPLVVAWLEKAMPYLRNMNTPNTYESTEYFQCRQLSAVYKFIRGMPLLVVDGYHMEKTKDKDIQSDAKKKRKFDLILK